MNLSYIFQKFLIINFCFFLISEVIYIVYITILLSYISCFKMLK